MQDNAIHHKEQTDQASESLSVYEQEETWKILADCQIFLTLAGLLKLVQRFTEKVTTLMAQKEAEHVLVNCSQPSIGPTIMDEQSPSIKVIIRGQEVARTIVDGGSGVNVINNTTCDKLEFTKWDACSFWLRMADTSTIRPLGLIRQLNVILGGHTFQISIVVLHMEAPGDSLSLSVHTLTVYKVITTTLYNNNNDSFWPSCIYTCKEPR